MRYISTSGQSVTDLRGAIMHSIAPDGSLYLPESIPHLPKAYFNNIEQMSLKEIAYVVVTSLLGTDVDSAALKKAVDAAYDFPMPLKKMADGTHVLELFEGPTMAFKDAGARFLAEFSNVYHKSTSRPIVGLMATTGNAGAAMANAFATHRDKRLVILFPRGSVSRMQIAQMSAAGPHVKVVEVDGPMSACRQIIKDAMADQQLSSLSMLININSVNIMRIIPQVVFPFYAYARLKASGINPDGMTYAFPCGGLSNLTAAIIAKRLGLPLGHIVAGFNANDDFVRVANGQLSLDKLNTSSRPTLAHAMDSGLATNLRRVLTLYNNNLDELRKDISAVSLSDTEIADEIRGAMEKGYIPDPCTAVALGALKRSNPDANKPRLVLATAHPAKSLDVMTQVTGRAIELPLQLTRFMGKAPMTMKIPPNYKALKRVLLNP